jgi:hypothetical protein
MIDRRSRVLRCAVIVGLLFATGALPGPVEAARKSRLLKPTEFGEALTLTVEGKKSSYWACDRENPLVLTVRGPGRVRLITRLAMDGSRRAAKYEIVVRRGEEEVVRHSCEALPAAKVSGGSSGAWGRHRNVTFEVPAGRHTYRVFLAEPQEGTVAVRPRFLKPRRPRRRVSIAPTSYERVLTLIRSEKEITYYHLTPDAPLKLSIVGPTELQVNTRLDFDRNMKGDSHSYSVEVREGGATVGRATFEVTRSQVAVYRNKLEVVPGVVKALSVPVPKGVHELEVWLRDTVASGAGAKLYLPAEDVN